jgi:hypothetical protein
MEQHRKRCSSDGCNNIVVKGGVCMTHGAENYASVKDAQIMIKKEENV